MRASALQSKGRALKAGERSGGERFPLLRIAVLLVWGIFITYCLFRLVEEPFHVVACGALIGTVALLPAYLWAEGMAPGLPILPLLMLTLLWTHALPLVAGHPEIGTYDTEDILFATVCIGLYAILATAVWIFVATRPVTARVRYRVLPRNRGFAFFAGAIWLAGVFITAAVTQFVIIDPALFGILRSSTLSFASIAMFVLAVRMARGELSPAQHLIFIAAVLFYTLANITTLFLVGAIVTTASALIGYTIGKGRVPWTTILVVLLLFGFLHGGKNEMREKYWAEDAPQIAVYQLPLFFAEWIVAGAYELTRSEYGGARYQPIYERVSLMHMLLLAQRRAPELVPYLEGATYAIIPAMLVPRIIDPDKPHSHTGTSMLNVHFGIQTEEDTERTTVGWGLVAEAYANFGLAGVLGIAIFIGLLFGYAGRLTVGAPVMSLESMVGVTFSAIAIQSEFTMAVFATVLFQSLLVLLIVVPFLEKRRAGETD